MKTVVVAVCLLIKCGADAFPQPAAISELVRSNMHCKSGDYSVGTFPSVEECAHAVKAAGGKFFVYGKGMFREGWCYIEYTESRKCPQGLESHSYDFYDIPSVSMDEYLRCHAEVVEVIHTDGNGNSVLSKGMMEKDQFKDSPLSMATYVRTESHRFFWEKVCRREFKLQCSGGIAKIDTYESCCYWSNSCTPSQSLSFSGQKKLPDRNSQWQVCKASEDASFVADPPTSPALPAMGSHDCHVTSVASISRTLRQIFNSCPTWLDLSLQALGSLNSASYSAMYALLSESARNHPIAALLGKSPDSTLLSPQVFDKYTIAQVLVNVHLNMRAYGGRNLPVTQRIAVPNQQAFLDRIRIYGWVGTPDHEIDDAIDGLGANTPMSERQLCIFDTLREWTFTHEVDDGTNSWDSLLGGNPTQPGLCPNNAQTCTKREYMQGVFSGYTTQDGDPVYPETMIDFGMFRQGPGSSFADAAEQFLGFGMIGAHRLEVLSGAARVTRNTEEGLYKIATSDLAALEVRPGFARMGADMYFNGNLEPIMILTPSGDQVWKSEAHSTTWQYWKFVWRSSLFLKVTVVDHLWTTHFSVGNALAAASREALPAAHPLRRLLSIFTWGTIAVNKNAAHQLVGPKHLLHRSSPFSDFGHVSEVAQASIPSFQSSFGAFLDDSLFQLLHQTVKDTPYIADGSLLFGALKQLVDDWFGLFESDWCDVSDAVMDPALEAFIQRFEAWSMHQAHAATDNAWLGLRVDGTLRCNGLKRWLVVMLFAVTGYHRHVGTVADIAADPEFSTWSWKEGEAYGRPLQHLQMSLIAASTAKIMPKILNDFSHLAEGLSKQTEAVATLQTFKQRMASVAAEIEARNQQRSVPYSQMDPNQVECSVAV